MTVRCHLTKMAMKEISKKGEVTEREEESRREAKKGKRSEEEK